MQVSHRQAVGLMVAVTLMWSIAGVVTRFLESARGFEITFWRSAVTVLALLPMLAWLRGPRVLWHRVRDGDRAFWLASLCWATMFTAFMLALSLTSVANVLVTMALAPLFTALGARFALGHKLAPRTWVAIVIAGAGIGWMYGDQLGAGDTRQLLGTAVALGVPIAAAVNWTLLQHLFRSADATPPPDMLAPVLLGALLSAALTLPLSLPFAATAHDLALLGLLGVVQLAIPCLLAVRIARVLSAPEVSLLSLLEVVFGVLWVWLLSAEAPSAAVLGGGLLVLGALAGNEALALWRPGARSLQPR